jgi:hypothetical protein
MRYISILFDIFLFYLIFFYFTDDPLCFTYSNTKENINQLCIYPKITNNKEKL